MAINDFGKKIGGAKKDLWKLRGMNISDLVEMNDAEKLKLITKDNVWPKPNYAELVEKGLPVKVAYYIKKVRDSISKQPELTYKHNTPEAIQERQENYIKFVGAIKDAVLACKSENDILALGKGWLTDNGYIAERNSWQPVSPTAAAGGVITNKFLRAFWMNAYDLRCLDREIAKKQFLYSDEQKILAKYEFRKYENAIWEMDYSNRLVVKVPVPGGASYIYPRGELADKNSWVEGSWYVRDGGKIVERNFESLESAQKFVLELNVGKDSIDAVKKKKGKRSFVPPQLKHIKREGDDVRDGRGADGQDYLDLYGFRGGEFGNWVSEKERQACLDFGYDAFFDLAKALKIDYKDISFENSLSIAFGSRGHGSAMAHYEPLRQVINLTKMKGAGSLAHEWGHGLDDILGKKLGLKGFMTENYKKPEAPKTLKALIDSMMYKTVLNEDTVATNKADAERYGKRLETAVRNLFPVSRMTEAQQEKLAQLIDDYVNKALDSEKYFPDAVWAGQGNKYVDALSAFKKEVTGYSIPKEQRIDYARYQYALCSKLKNIEVPVRVETDFYSNSKKFNDQHSKTNNGYWSSKVEMFARAFSCYVLDKVAENGDRSDYLCGHSEIHRMSDEDKVICAYPVGEERKVINKCFDDFISELKDMELLHHKEDFVLDRPALAEPTKDGNSVNEEEKYPNSLFDVLSDAYDRVADNGVGEQMSFDFKEL